jgi:uncharacterized protein (DUF58 family)
MKSWITPRFRWRSRDPERPRLTSRGRRVLAVGAALLATGLFTSHAPLSAIGLYGVLLAFAARTLAGRNLRGLTCRHLLPDKAHVGEPAHVALTIRNPRRRLPAFGVAALDDIMSQPQPRVVAVQGIAAGAENTAVHLVLFNQRGIHKDIRVRLASDFPFGLARCRRAFTLADAIVVYPKPRRFPGFLERLVSGGGAESAARSGATGDAAGEFRSLREFRPGDTPKLISWPVSSRTGRLVMRELDRPTPRQMHVVFHNFQPYGTFLADASFENALRLLAGIFLDLQTLGVSFTFNAAHTGWTNLSVNSNHGSLTVAFAGLATAAATTQSTPDQAINAVNAAPAGAEAVLVVSNCPLRHWIALFQLSSVPVICLDNHGLLNAGDATRAEAARTP